MIPLVVTVYYCNIHLFAFSASADNPLMIGWEKKEEVGPASEEVTDWLGVVGGVDQLHGIDVNLNHFLTASTT